MQLLEIHLQLALELYPHKRCEICEITLRYIKIGTPDCSIGCLHSKGSHVGGWSAYPIILYCSIQPRMNINSQWIYITIKKIHAGIFSTVFTFTKCVFAHKCATTEYSSFLNEATVHDFRQWVESTKPGLCDHNNETEQNINFYGISWILELSGKNWNRFLLLVPYPLQTH